VEGAPMQLLENKVAIVTGSSRGIGRAIALAFAQEGCKVVVNYCRSKEKAMEVSAEIVRINPNGSIVVQADVSAEVEVERMVDKTITAFGKLHILVNNAGVAHKSAFVDISLSEWEHIIQNNLTSVFLCTRIAIPHLLKNGWGRIINISSTSGITGGTSGAHYAAAKGGVIAFTKALSSEFAQHGITVNAIVPSKIETDILWGSLDEKGKETLLQKIPVRRFGQPEEIASLALFLASENAGYITGEAIVASGGYR
jgi:3-oxoacyl-[acyl-carrier protein] reductase